MPGASGGRQPPPLADILSHIGGYYGAKVARHGATPLGVDWSCAPTQELRFVQLLKLVGAHRDFSINDVGCGYGALLPFMRKRLKGASIDYAGYDICEAMVEAARRRHKAGAATCFIASDGPLRSADFSVASGIFNVRLHWDDAAWRGFVARTLDGMARASRKGFAVNFLLAGQMPPLPPELYSAQAEEWAGHCRSAYGVKVEVLAGYGLREFTLLAT